MNHIKLNISVTQTKYKPSGQEVGKISNEVGENTTELTIDDLVDKMLNGYSISTCAFDGERVLDKWVSGQLVIVDCDNGVHIDTIMNNLGRTIRPNFVLESYSSTLEWPKYHIGFVINQVLTDPKDYEAVVDNITYIIGKGKGFEKVDKKRISNGYVFSHGKKLEVFCSSKGEPHILKDNITIGDESMVNPVRLVFPSKAIVGNITYGTVDIRALAELTRSRVGRHSNRCQSHTYSSLPSGEECTTLLLYSNRKRRKSSPRGSKPRKPRKSDRQITATRVDPVIGHPLLYSSCMKYRDIRDRVVTTSHDERFRWSAVIHHMMPEIRDDFYNDIEHVSDRDWRSTTVNRLSDVGPNLTTCCNVCSYRETCNRNIVGRLYTILTNPPELINRDYMDYVTADQARHYTRLAVNKACSDKDTNIHIIKAEPGTGKTRATKDKRDVTIAYPNHALKDEVFRDRPDAHVTLGMPDVSNKHIAARIRALYGLRKHGLADSLLLEHADNREDAEKYIEQKSKPLEGTVLTTHDKLFFTHTTNDTIIIDEDPIESIIQQHKYSVHDLKAFANSLPPAFSEYSDWILALVKSPKKEIFIPEDISVEFMDVLTDHAFELWKDQGIYIDVKSLMQTSASYKQKSTVTTCHIRQLPTDKKIIILSATISVDLYKALFGDRVVTDVIRPCINTGQVVWHNNRSYSKSQIDNSYLSEYNELVKRYEYIITYKTDSSEWHFGKIEGTNIYDNCDELGIVGTPRLPSTTVALTASAISKQVHENTAPELIKDLQIDQFQTDYYTYTDELMRTVDLAYTKTQVLQAIGRARPIVNDCVVHYHGAYPVSCLTIND